MNIKNNQHQHKSSQTGALCWKLIFSVLLLSLQPWSNVYSSDLPQPKNVRFIKGPYSFDWYLRWDVNWYEAGSIGDTKAAIVGRCVYRQDAPGCENIGEFTFPHHTGTASQVFHNYATYSSHDNYFWRSSLWNAGMSSAGGWACVQYYYRVNDSSTRHFIGNKVCAGDTPPPPLRCTIPALIEINYGNKMGGVDENRTDNTTLNCTGDGSGTVKLKLGTSRLDLGNGIISTLSVGNKKGLFNVTSGANQLPIRSTLTIPAGARAGEHYASTTLTMSYP